MANATNSTMRPSSPDMVAFVVTVNNRALATLHKVRQRGGAVAMTADLNSQLLAGADLYARFVSRLDWRHTDAELGRLAGLADWCIARDAELTGGEARGWQFDPKLMVRVNGELSRAAKTAFLRRLLDRRGDPRGGAAANIAEDRRKHG